VQRAEEHGLQFLGESHLSVMASCNFAADVDATLQRISRDIIQIEQYMDFLRNRTFRQTLLCHAQQQLDRSLDPRRVRSLYLAARLKPDDLELDVAGPARVAFWDGSIKVETGDPLIKAALLHLGQTWPHWVAFDTLLAEARRRVGPLPASGVEEDQALRLGEHLIRCFAAAAVDMHSIEPPFVRTVSQRPLASPLMRHQAHAGVHITNRKHETATVDPLCRHALRVLDGTRDQESVLDQLQRLVEVGELTIEDNGQGVAEPVSRDTLREKLTWSLRQLASVALLVG
jgi:methyltransferase-like protein